MDNLIDSGIFYWVKKYVRELGLREGIFDFDFRCVNFEMFLRNLWDVKLGIKYILLEFRG